MLNKKFLAIAIAVFAVGLSACAKKSEKKEAEDLVSEAKSHAAAMDTTNRELIDGQRINLAPLYGGDVEDKAKRFDWSNLSASERASVKAKLKSQKSRAARIVEIASHKNISVNGSIDIIPTVGRNAGYYLESLEYFERTGRLQAG